MFAQSLWQPAPSVEYESIRGLPLPVAEVALAPAFARAPSGAAARAPASAPARPPEQALPPFPEALARPGNEAAHATAYAGSSFTTEVVVLHLGTATGFWMQQYAGRVQAANLAWSTMFLQKPQ